MKRLTETAEKVLEARYFLDGEDWGTLCDRVASAVASVEKEEVMEVMRAGFKQMIHDMDFLPNSPCLMNAGTKLGQLSACFVLPIEDNLDSIFTTIKNAALVNKTGGGTGFSFSSLRPKAATVCSTNGVASGPLSFMEVFNSATDVIKQGGRRRGANMGVLNVTHPDIIDFIKAKEVDGRLSNFNLSVAVTDAFMEAVQSDGTYELIDPSTGEAVKSLKAREVWDLIVEKAHANGEPGVLFIDAANRANPTPWLGEFASTNPCSEQVLLPYEACNLGSINLANFVIDNDRVDYVKLADVTRLAVRFLDNVVDVSTFPVPEIKEMTLSTRKIGLGIMGLHDMLIQLGLPYDSEDGRELAAQVMQFIEEVAMETSKILAREKGHYPAYESRPSDAEVECRRNAALTSIQPTGTVSMIADCASGCEPYFAVVTRKHVMDGQDLFLVNKYFEQVAREEGWYTDELMQKVADTGTVVGHEEIPKFWWDVFKGAQDISVEGHIGMQAALQRHIDSSISKTINMPESASVGDVSMAYLSGWKSGCKGLTVYRDGSRTGQVLNAGAKKEQKQSEGNKLDLPDTIDAKRFRLKDKDGNSVYIIICFDENEQPVEVFAKFPYDNRVETQDKSTMWATTCRLVSLSLRCGIPIDEIIKQLDRSSAHMFDLPAQLSKLLKTFQAQTRVGYKGAPCPDCGATMIFEEGCSKCPECGYSKCS